jgi:Phosphotransferase enzyme family
MLMAARANDDSGFPTLQDALDPKSAAIAIAKDLQEAGFGSVSLSVEIERVRIKPGRKALIGYRLTGRDANGAPFDQRMMLTLWVDGDPARLPAMNGSDATQPVFGPPTMAIPHLQGSAWFFPNDRKIAHIAGLMAEGRVRGAAEVVHYVPEQGCTIRVTGEGDVLYGKARADDRGAVAASISETKSSAIRLAPIVSYDPEQKILWQHAVDGQPVPLSALVVHANLWAPRIADAITAFHGLPKPSGLKTLTAESIAKTVKGRIERTAAIMPDLEHRLNHLARRLGAIRPAETPTVLSHCDLHPTNLLWDGSSFALIDLDTAALAPAALDHGTLVASVAHRALDEGASVERVSAMLEQFRNAAAFPHFDWFIAASLLGERLYRCGTRLKSRQFKTRKALVDLADFCLDRMEKVHG